MIRKRLPCLLIAMSLAAAAGCMKGPMAYNSPYLYSCRPASQGSASTGTEASLYEEPEIVTSPARPGKILIVQYDSTYKK